tara:strand:+ start:67298 stop:67495 length:198 start_codon:yes stop_codon:yes gene_type:complete
MTRLALNAVKPTGDAWSCITLPVRTMAMTSSSFAEIVTENSVTDNETILSPLGQKPQHWSVLVVS